MTVVVMMILGASVGVGLLLTFRALMPVSQPMSEVFESVEGSGVAFRSHQTSRPRSGRDAFVAAGKVLTIGDDVQLRKDLAVTGSSIEQHALVKAVAPAAAIVGVYVLWLGLVGAGASLSPLYATFGALVAAAVAFVVPDVRLRTRAKAARIGFRHALSAYLDLVTIIMSGGGGLVTALQSAADSGDGWAFAEIRAALDRARLSNRTPWSQLGVLGERFDIPELRDLVATAELAGSEGARIAESVATKSDVLRARLQAEVEQASESLTEQMLLPVGLLLVALFLFLGFAVFQQLGSDAAPALESTLNFWATHSLILSSDAHL